MIDLETFAGLVERRRSVRRYADRPVPAATLERLLRVARCAPSGGNLQPGGFVQVAGDARMRLSAALLAAHREGRAQREDYSYFPDPMPAALKRRQVLAARGLYEALGIARDDRAGRAAHFERNFTFFDAPVALVVTIDAGLGSGCYMDLGMALYGLMLAAAAEGLGTCAIGTLASHPDLVRMALALAADRHVICGLAIGWPDEAAAENGLRTERAALADYVSLIE